MWDFFDPIVETVTDVGEWMSTNPGATSAIGGMASAGISYMENEKKIEADMRKAREERDWRASRSMASTGDDNYGSHYAGLTQGLLVK